MARQKRKKFHDPRQLSFNFDVMIDHIENIDNENNFNTNEVQDDYRTNSTVRNSDENSSDRNNSRSTATSRPHQSGLFDIRPMGFESTGGTNSISEDAKHGVNNDSLRAISGRKESFDQREKRSNDEFGDGGVRDIGITRDRDSVDTSQINETASTKNNLRRSSTSKSQQPSLFDSSSFSEQVVSDEKENFSNDRLEDDGLQDIEIVWDRDKDDTPSVDITNYRICVEDNLGSGGASVKFEDNIKAITLLHHLEKEGAKKATLEEQKVLVRYVGWGGMPQAFDSENEKWKKQYQQLRAILPDDVYAQARRSTQDAHYTSKTVIEGIYAGLEQFGIHNNFEHPLQVLEPSAGIGNFIGLVPFEASKIEFTAIELDPTTAQISKYLYPKSRHVHRSFQDTPILDRTFDIVVGNPPFGQQTVFDSEHPELRNLSIHNYFLAKSISKLREGGIAAFVVSRYFMDAVDDFTRTHIADQAEFLGAKRWYPLFEQ